MNKKRITLFCSSFPPETGAAPGRMYQLAKLLQSAGYELTVICAMPNYPTGKIFKTYKGKLLHGEILDGILVKRIWLIPTHSSNKIKRALSLISYSFSIFTLGLKQLLKSKPNLVILSSPPFVTGYFGLMLTGFTKAKTILNVSDLWPKTAFDLGFLKEGKLYQILLRSEKKMYQKASAISVQSEEIKDHILSIEPYKQIFVYRNLQQTLSKARTQRPEGKRKIVYAGLLGIAQGVLDIMKSIDFNALNTELHIYGLGNELEAVKSWLLLHPNKGVYYHGSAAAVEMPEIFTQYHAMLVPLAKTIDGAVPSKIFNAMANGLPILYSGNGEASEIVSRTKTGFVNDAGDFEGLKTNIQKLILQDNTAYETLRNNCRISSENEFNKSNQDKMFLNFLENILGE